MPGGIGRPGTSPRGSIVLDDRGRAHPRRILRGSWLSNRALTKVAVNLLWCRPGQVGGSEDYLVRQLVGLAEIDAPFTPTLFAVPSFAQAHPELAALYPIVEAPIAFTNRVRRVLSEYRWLRQRTAAFPLVHHGGGTVPSTVGRVVLTIHDLQHLRYPNYVHWIKRQYLDWALPRSVAHANAIAVPTEFVRGDSARRLRGCR